MLYLVKLLYLLFRNSLLAAVIVNNLIGVTLFGIA
jgi:hypothetical protein